MLLYQFSLLVSLLVLHNSLAFLNNDDSDPVETFQLTVSPAQVNRHTTDKMTLRCERNPKVKTEMHQIFTMKIVKQSKTGWSVVAEQRIEEDSARVEENVTASSQLMGDISNVFLQVNWDTIGSDNFGKFMCVVAGVDAQYNFVKEHSSEIDIHEVKIPIDYFVLLSKKTNKMAEELNETIQNEIPSLKKSLKNVETEIPSLKKGLEDLGISTENRFKTLDESTERKLKSLDDSTDTRFTTLDGEMSSTQKRLETLELFLGGLTQWPEGFYALLQPKTGCPVDLAFFGGTHKFHTLHTEGGDSSSSSALGPHVDFRSGTNRFITLEFCEVTKQFNTESWPQGSFCVNKQIHKSCPAGFTDGYVDFDTEDGNAVAEARNNVADTLHDPYFFFCCQDSGSASDPIQLPTSSPFLLYRYGGVCQAVQGMSVSEEYVKIDTENNRNSDSVYGSHPDVEMGKSKTKLYLCYYTKL